MRAPFVNPHQEIINGLMHIVGYLQDNPDLPAPSDVSVNWLVGGDDSTRVATVREVGRFLNVEPVWDEQARQVWAHWRFPGGVIFAALAQLQALSTAGTEDTVLLPLPERPCLECRGTGYYDDGTCPWCLGKGVVGDWSPRTEASQ